MPNMDGFIYFFIDFQVWIILNEDEHRDPREARPMGGMISRKNPQPRPLCQASIKVCVCVVRSKDSVAA
jgi:hypothetical protein